MSWSVGWHQQNPHWSQPVTADTSFRSVVYCIFTPKRRWYSTEFWGHQWDVVVSACEEKENFQLSFFFYLFFNHLIEFIIKLCTLYFRQKFDGYISLHWKDKSKWTKICWKGLLLSFQTRGKSCNIHEIWWIYRSIFVIDALQQFCCWQLQDLISPF